jgi:DNA-binding HxlR family transcriptional regulator
MLSLCTAADSSVVDLGFVRERKLHRSWAAEFAHWPYIETNLALPLENQGLSSTGNDLIDALELLTHGHHAAVLHAIAGGAAFMPHIRQANGFAIDEASTISVLKQLIACGTVARSVHSGPPLRVEYRLTEAGRALLNVVLSAREWVGGPAHRKSELG